LTSTSRRWLAKTRVVSRRHRPATQATSQNTRAALPDARLAADQYQPGITAGCAPEGARHQVEPSSATYESRTGNAATHDIGVATGLVCSRKSLNSERTLVGTTGLCAAWTPSGYHTNPEPSLSRLQARPQVSVYTNVYLEIPSAGGAVKVTSNAGAVQQALDSKTTVARTLKLTYPPVWDGQTRVVTATYAIPAGPGTTDGFRAVKGYASLCVFGNVYTNVDSGAVNVVFPDGFDVIGTGGQDLPNTSTANGQKTFSTPAADVSSCMAATNPAGLAKTTATSGNTTFSLETWPEDSDWATKVGGYVTTDVAKIQDLTGLPMPAGPLTIREAGKTEVGVADATGGAPLERVAEDASEAQVVHAISRAAYRQMFADPWMSAGLAGYTEQATGAAGCYKPAVTPDFSSWATLTLTSSSSERTTSDWEDEAACYVFTQWEAAIGTDRFKEALSSAYKRQIAYLGAGPAETVASGQPISAKALLDMIDERGMVPAGVTDLDQAQSLIADNGVFTADELSARSAARTRYHGLTATAAGWKMPLALRSPMAAWDFAAAQKAMDTITQIFSNRDKAEKTVGGLKLDGTSVQKNFESAAKQSDLDAVLVLAKGESDAASKVLEATQLKDGSRTVLQSVGLLGADLTTPLTQARTALDNVKPADASSSAQSVIDTINKSNDQGVLRVAVVAGILLATLLLVIVGLLLRRRRRRRMMPVAPVPPTDGLLAAAALPEAEAGLPSDRTAIDVPAVDAPAIDAPAEDAQAAIDAPAPVAPEAEVSQGWADVPYAGDAPAIDAPVEGAAG
jgi:hypothetical protein